MNKYIGITIGPIYDTMMLARKTREFWSASIIFSILSKQICSELLNHGVEENDFIIPYKSTLTQPIKTVGLFNDRIVFKNSINISLDDLKILIDKAKSTLINQIEKVNGNNSISRDYFKIYACELLTVEENPLKTLLPQLDQMEIFNVADSEIIGKDVRGLREFLQNVNTTYKGSGSGEALSEKSNFLKEYYDLKDINAEIRIPSVGEIALAEYVKTRENDHDIKKAVQKTLKSKGENEDNLIDILLDKEKLNDLGLNDKITLNNFHKYYCFIQADGDKVGSAIMGANSLSDINSVSKGLYNWGKKALEIMEKYGALPIYIGGDDVLIIAPVNNGKKDILTFAHELNQSFINTAELKNAGSGLSIGIKIGYHKSPLYEHYEDSYQLLQAAKSHHTSPGLPANACAVQLDKNSSQPHIAVFSFTNEFNEFIKPLLDSMTLDEKEKSFITSIFYELRDNEEVLQLIYEDEDRLWQFFENNFDEAKPSKKETDKYRFIKAISGYLKYLFTTFRDKKGNDGKSKNQKDHYTATIHLYSTLKLIRFIKGLDNE